MEEDDYYYYEELGAQEALKQKWLYSGWTLERETEHSLHFSHPFPKRKTIIQSSVPEPKKWGWFDWIFKVRYLNRGE